MKVIYDLKSLSIVDISDLLSYSRIIYYWTNIPMKGVYIIFIWLVLLH